MERADALTNAVVFLLDVDNTLFDNDRFATDLTERLTQDFGAAGSARYWELYTALLTTVFVRQGRYASAATGVTLDPPPDRLIERIADLNVLHLPELS